ncbi:hypothetical protein HDU96_003104 [Phlyctochytrium bullatum]|nr:hypothetical protein HDU96_003104 [Phlyctochytrium bullatum]
MLCFILLTIFVIVARHTFSRYLRDAVLPEVEKERAAAEAAGEEPSGGSWGGRGSSDNNRRKSSLGVGASFGGGSSSGKKRFRSKSTAIANALKAGIATLSWLATGLVVFVLYSGIFAAAVLFVGYPDAMYFVTLFVNWSTPFFFGFIIFLIILVRTIRQLRDFKEDHATLHLSTSSQTSQTHSGIAPPPLSPLSPVPVSSFPAPPPRPTDHELATFAGPQPTSPIHAFYNPELHPPASLPRLTSTSVIPIVPPSPRGEEEEWGAQRYARGAVAPPPVAKATSPTWGEPVPPSSQARWGETTTRWGQEEGWRGAQGGYR